MAKLFKVAKYANCGGCNLRTSLYWIASTQEEAYEDVAKVIKDGGNALCGICMCGLIVHEKYNIDFCDSAKLTPIFLEE